MVVHNCSCVVSPRQAALAAAEGRAARAEKERGAQERSMAAEIGDLQAALEAVSAQTGALHARLDALSHERQVHLPPPSSPFRA